MLAPRWARLLPACRHRRTDGTALAGLCRRHADVNFMGVLLLYALLRLRRLPAHPQGMDAVAPDLAFNTAVN
ncbi:MAG: hypothetical protein U1E35_05965 [Rhodospirillales bacterium]